jgi:hypothetical protein
MSVEQRIDMRPMMQLAVLGDYTIPFTIRVIADLGVADHLADGPRHVDQLAAATGCASRPLYRALRALASRGIFIERSAGVFALTPMAEVLRSDHPYSLREGFPLLPADVQAWAKFDYSVRTGKPSFDQVHGQTYWSYLKEHPEDRSRFDKAMRCYSRVELRAVLSLYDWASFGTLVDIGGGNGGFLAGLLPHFPSLRGVLFDFPHVVADAPATLEAAGVADRCEIVPGTAFDGVPPGHDGYMMKRVLYDWDDEHAVTMLRAIRVAMRPDSRLLILDPIAERIGAYEYALSVDMLMLAMVTGYTRTREELAGLLAQAGLEMTRLIATPNFPIVEARPLAAA